MEIILYRHAEPAVSDQEKISGRDFPQWVQRYNASGILKNKLFGSKEKIVYTSDLLRSKDTGRLIGKKIVANSLIREAQIPLIRFPAIRLKAKFWLVIARSLWLFGLKTKCESSAEAKIRARQAVAVFEAQVLSNGRIVIVGHGFINRLIKKELLQRGWLLKQKTVDHGFLSQMRFEIEP
jgi:broad specificity phosphatase PhoE